MLDEPWVAGGFLSQVKVSLKIVACLGRDRLRRKPHAGKRPLSQRAVRPGHLVLEPVPGDAISHKRDEQECRRKRGDAGVLATPAPESLRPRNGTGQDLVAGQETP